MFVISSSLIHGNIQANQDQVTNYDVSGINMVYSSAEIYTHTASSGKRILLLYGLAGETHELAFSSTLGKPTVEGGSVKTKKKKSTYVVQWEVTEKRKVLHYGNKLDVYLLWRNEAFNYWVLQLESPQPIGNYTSQSKRSSSQKPVIFYVQQSNLATHSASLEISIVPSTSKS